MKITKQQLKQIIQEELEVILSEGVMTNQKVSSETLNNILDSVKDKLDDEIDDIQSRSYAYYEVEKNIVDRMLERGDSWAEFIVADAEEMLHDYLRVRHQGG